MTKRILGTVATAAVAVIAASAPASAAAASPIAQSARTLDVVEHARLRLERKDGNRLYERGTATGTLPGSVRAVFDVKLTSVTGEVTFYPRSGGSITLTVVGHATSVGVRSRFTGNIAARRGTGRYRRVTGSGTFDGVVNRNTWAASVTARARLTY